MQDTLFEPGCRVAIRDWDDMAGEYGVDDDGDICIEQDKPYFITSMKRLCGNEYIVDWYDAEDDVVGLIDFFEPFTITTGMLRLVSNRVMNFNSGDMERFLEEAIMCH